MFLSQQCLFSYHSFHYKSLPVTWAHSSGRRMSVALSPFSSQNLRRSQKASLLSSSPTMRSCDKTWRVISSHHASGLYMQFLYKYASNGHHGDCGDQTSIVEVHRFHILLSHRCEKLGVGLQGSRHRRFSTYYGSTKWFLRFTTVQKRYAFSRNCTLNSEFWSFPGLVICGKLLSWCWTAAASTSSQPATGLQG